MLSRIATFLVKNKVFIILIFVLILFRIPSLFEPTWYGDEGVYAAVGNDINQGKVLYSETWDNKTPLIYYTYAIVFKIFGVNLLWVKVLSLIFSIILFIYFFRIFRLLFPDKKFISAGVLFIIFWGAHFFEANIASGENFFVPISVAATFYFLKYILRTGKNIDILIAGLLWGIAFLYKIHPLFDIIGVLLFYIVFILRPNSAADHSDEKFITVRGVPELLSQKIMYLAKTFIIIATGFITPALIFLIGASASSSLGDFLQMFLSQSGTYVFDFKNAAFGLIFFESTLVTRTILLLIIFVVLAYLFFKHKINVKYFLVLNMFIFSAYALLFSGRPYPHYLLQIFIPFILLLVLVYQVKRDSFSLLKFSSIGFLILYFVLNIFYLGQRMSVYNSPIYYANFISYAAGFQNEQKYNDTFDSHVNPLQNLLSNTQELRGQKVFLMENLPWYYPLSGVINPSKYTALYHLGQDRVNLNDFATTLSHNAKYIIINSKSYKDLVPSELKKIIGESYFQYKMVGDFVVFKNFY